MPIYEYQCGDCSDEFETLIWPSDSEPPSCPQCGSERLTRLVSTFGYMGGSNRGGKSACAGCTSGRCSSCG